MDPLEKFVETIVESLDLFVPNLMVEKGLGGFLVSNQESGNHLPTTVDGKISRAHVGAAWAALHGGYRGHKYTGPDKDAALAKLRKIYKDNNWPMPG